MTQYLVRESKLHYEVTSFDDSRYPINVYTIFPRRCNCPARSNNCKHVKILEAWKKDNMPIGAIYNDLAVKTGQLEMLTYA